MNRISSEQKAFFERRVRELEPSPHAKWRSLWKHAPDPTLLDIQAFAETAAEGHNLPNVFFFSPSRLKQWKKLRVEMPLCAYQAALSIEALWFLTHAPRLMRLRRRRTTVSRRR